MLRLAHVYVHHALRWPELFAECRRASAPTRECANVLANLGRLDKLEGAKLDPLIHGLQRRALSRAPTSAPVPEYDTR